MRHFFNILPAVLLSATLAACSGNSEKTAKGIVCEASMNTLTIIDEKGDTLAFSTMDAEVTTADGLLLGDTATVTYAGTVDGTKDGLLAAVNVTVAPAPRSETAPLTGSWTQPVEGQPGKVQGVRFEADGTAASINMATLVYENWKQTGDSLILTGKSIGNGQTISFSDTTKIEKVTADSLILSQKGFTFPAFLRGE